MLKHHNWNMTHTAAAVGISRQGLFKKIRRYSILMPRKESEQEKSERENE
jgi:DNA-binding NtrC family response regulator